jgi:hypothetical protein
MKGDESLAEVRLSLTSFDAWTVRRVADRVNRKARLSTVQAASQAAVSDTRRISRASLRDAYEHEAGEIPANCVSGLVAA